MARRSIDDEIVKLEETRDRLEQTLTEQEGYHSLTAQGRYGAETQFTDVSKIYGQLATIHNKLEAYYAQKGI